MERKKNLTGFWGKYFNLPWFKATHYLPLPLPYPRMIVIRHISLPKSPPSHYGNFSWLPFFNFFFLPNRDHQQTRIEKYFLCQETHPPMHTPLCSATRASPIGCLCIFLFNFYVLFIKSFHCLTNYIIIYNIIITVMIIIKSKCNFSYC